MNGKELRVLNNTVNKTYLRTQSVAEVKRYVLILDCYNYL